MIKANLACFGSQFSFSHVLPNSQEILSHFRMLEGPSMPFYGYISKLLRGSVGKGTTRSRGQRVRRLRGHPQAFRGFLGSSGTPSRAQGPLGSLESRYTISHQKALHAPRGFFTGSKVIGLIGSSDYPCHAPREPLGISGDPLAPIAQRASATRSKGLSIAQGSLQ